MIYFENHTFNVFLASEALSLCSKPGHEIGFILFCLYINSVKRTQVLDDESDYFATDSNQWLSPGERDNLRKHDEELRELRHASRKDRKITLDFAGRRVLDEGQNLNQYYNK